MDKTKMNEIILNKDLILLGTLIDELIKKARKAKRELKEFEIKRIATITDYETLLDYWSLYLNGKISKESYNEMSDFVFRMIGKRWGCLEGGS